SGTLTFNRSDALTYAGVVSGTGALQKSGTGTLTLSGANTYSGNTTINTTGGNITISGSGSLGTVTDGSAAYAGNIAITSSTSTLTFASSTTQEFSGVVSLAGKLTKSTGSGTLTLSGDNSYTGVTEVSAGSLKITHANALGASAAGQGTTVGDGASLEVGAVTSAEPLTVSGAGAASAGAINFTGAGTLSGTVAMSAGSTVAVASSTTARLSGIVSGAFELAKAGTGTLELTATNTYSGGTTISGGTLSVGVGGAAGSITGNVTNNANITFNRSDAQTFSSVISGSGTLTKLGAQTLNLTGANTYSGGTTVSAGTLSVGAGGTIGAIAGDVTNNATLVYNRSDSVSFAGAISGTGAVTKSGSNTLTLTANGSYTGATTISGGALVLQNNAPSTSSSTFGGAGTLTIEPASGSFTSAFSTTGFSFGSTLTGLTLGKSGNTADLTFATSATITGPVVMYADDIALSAALTATSSNISFNATGAVTQSAAVTSSGLALIGTGTFTLANTSNNVATIAAGSSSSRATSVTYRDTNALNIGTVNPTGIWSSGDVSISTASGDLTFSESINTTSTSSTAVTLNAGVDTAAGTSTGGNIIVSGSPTLTMGTGGIARLFSGSVDGSTGLTTFIGAGSGRFRYNSDESATNYTLALSAGSTNAIYRERPTLTVTASAQNLAYGTAIPTSAFTVSGKNSDTAAQAFSSSPTVGVVPSLPYPRGTHTLTPSGGTEVLGYLVSYATGTLTVATKTLTIGGSFTANNKVYDGTATAGILVNSLSLVGIEGSENVTLTPVLTFNDRNVGDGKAVTITSSSSLGGSEAGNYTLSVTGSPTTTASVTAKALTVSGLSSIDKEYNNSLTATVTGTAALQTAVAASFGADSTDGKPYNADSVSVTGTPVGAFNSKNVTAATTVSFTGLSLTGSGFGNYTLTAHPTVSRVITAKALTMTGTTIANKQYDASRAAGTLTVGTLTGFVVAETVTAAGLAGDYASANVGTRASSVTYTLSDGDNGGLGSNYSLASQSVNGTITAKPLSITAPTIASKVYNASDAAGAVTVGTLSGFVSPE
ncbi:MAG: beta strand repeat-containing protein, partial [Actinomycetota bacterium]